VATYILVANGGAVWKREEFEALSLVVGERYVKVLCNLTMGIIGALMRDVMNVIDDFGRVTIFIITVLIRDRFI